MDERPDQIINEIEAHRDELGRNLHELEHRVRRTADWRTYYERNPMMMIGAALGGGVLLGSMIGRRGHSGSSYSSSSSSWSIPYADSQGSTRSSYSSPRSSSSSMGEAALGFSSAGAGYAAGSSASTPSASAQPSSSSSSITSKLSSVAAPLKSAMQRSEVSDSMDHIKAALIAFGISKAKEFLTQAVPGIDQHLSEAERKHQSQKQGVGSFGESGGSGSNQWGDPHAQHGSSQQGQHGNTSNASQDQQNSFNTGSTWDTKSSDPSSSTGSGSSSKVSEHHTPAVTY